MIVSSGPLDDGTHAQVADGPRGRQVVSRSSKRNSHRPALPVVEGHRPERVVPLDRAVFGF
jgi:hypothetical protein